MPTKNRWYTRDFTRYDSRAFTAKRMKVTCASPLQLLKLCCNFQEVQGSSTFSTAQNLNWIPVEYRLCEKTVKMAVCANILFTRLSGDLTVTDRDKNRQCKWKSSKNVLPKIRTFSNAPHSRMLEFLATRVFWCYVFRRSVTVKSPYNRLVFPRQILKCDEIVRVEIAASLYLWEVRMTVLPSFTMPVIMFHKNRRAFGSIPVVGSSWDANETKRCQLMVEF